MMRMKIEESFGPYPDRLENSDLTPTESRGLSLVSTPDFSDSLSMFPKNSILSHSIFTILAYTALSLAVYAYASYTLTLEITPLQDRCEQLQSRFSTLKKQKSELTSIVSSLSDPAADEYALITELGRVPSGNRLIVIHPSPPPSS